LPCYLLDNFISVLFYIKILVFGRPFVKRFALCYQTVVCLSCPVLSVSNVGVLWPNGSMDQEEKLGKGIAPGHVVLDGDPAATAPKGGTAPNFRPMSIVAKRLNKSRCHFVRR